MPEVLGVPEEQFIWLRNAGNIITGPLGSTMRSIALACAVKGGKEIAIIGHTDCKVRHTSASDLIDRLRNLGIDRAKLPDNVNEFFGLFASERANILKAVDFVRQSPIIGAAIPVHGLLVDIRSGALEWLVNGYNALNVAGTSTLSGNEWTLPPFDLGTMKFPDSKIGDSVIPSEATPPTPEIKPPAKVRLKEPEAIPIPPRILRGSPRRH
jgi:carbonic anhydrase